MSDDLPSIHPEHEEIGKAAAIHAAYYRALVFVHGLHPDNATELTKVFMELAVERADED